MNKTFVVLDTTGVGFDISQEVLYAGQDENKAREFTVDTLHCTLLLEVWVEGILIQNFTKKDIYEWIPEFDRMKTLEQEINKVELVKQEKEKELNVLKSMLENNK